MNTIAFTLGHEESYDSYLCEQIPDGPKKLGFREVGSSDYPEGYQGGTVWKTKDEALSYIQRSGLKNYATYSIQMPDQFEKCVRKGLEGSDLLIDCLILEKVK